MLGLGFGSGLPLLLSGFTLRQWLTERGVSPGVMGLVGLVGWSYTLKFLWAPVLDQVAPPFGLARFGRRRGWMLAAQPVLAAAIAGIAWIGDADGPQGAILAAAVVAFCSATQDIAIDAWRIETFPPAQQGLANAFYVWGYRIGMLAARSGTLAAASLLGWHGAWLATAALAAAGMAVTLAAPEPEVPPMPRSGRLLTRLGRAAVESLGDFLARRGAVPILAYVALFNLGEAMAGVMLPALYHALGFARLTVAALGPFILGGTMAGIGAGGALVARLGVARGLIVTGFFQMSAMALYVWLALAPRDHTLLFATTTVEAFAQGCATAAFLAYLSGLCSTAHTATQFAVLTSVAPLASNTVGSFSGFLAEAVGWPAFYGLAMLASLPGMLLMLRILGRYPLDWGAAAARLRAQT
jgi:PAT family beta-lactamase induction signal transducer AmpG